MAQQPPVEAPPAPSDGQAPAGAWVDPYRAYNFKLEIQGVTAGHFTQCNGLGIRVDPIEYREAGNNTVHRVAGRVDYGDLTLSYGLTSSSELFTWFLTAGGAAVITILLMKTPVLSHLWDGRPTGIRQRKQTHCRNGSAIHSTAIGKWNECDS